MGEIVTIEEWRMMLEKEKVLLLITKKTCQDCIKVEEYLKLKKYQLDGVLVEKVSLDSPKFEKLSTNLKWIEKEVDVIPFWTLMKYGERVSTIRGGIKEARNLITSFQGRRFQED
jgi:hypothetical protein